MRHNYYNCIIQNPRKDDKWKDCETMNVVVYRDVWNLQPTSLKSENSETFSTTNWAIDFIDIHTKYVSINFFTDLSLLIWFS